MIIDPSIFYQTVMYFISSYMKYKSNAKRVPKEEKNGSNDSNESAEEGEEVGLNFLRIADSNINFIEENLGDMTSESYLIQDSDQFISVLAKILQLGEHDLPW